MKKENYATTPLYFLGFWIIVSLLWWGMAFYPAKNIDNSWLENARRVCFGIAENGLPETYGWMLLVLGPLSFLIVLIVAWPTDLFYGIKDLMRKKAGLAVGLVGLFAFSLVGSWFYQKVSYASQLDKAYLASYDEQTLPENYPRTKKTLPDFSLVDQKGEQISNETIKGKKVILTFAFAHCQTVCPLLVRNALKALDSLESPKVRLLVITLDPWRDTPGSLPGLAETWELPNRSHVLSGKIEEVNEVIASFGIPTDRNEDNGDIQHPALSYVIDQEGYIAYTFNDASPQWLKEAITRLEK